MIKSELHEDQQSEPSEKIFTFNETDDLEEKEGEEETTNQENSATQEEKIATQEENQIPSTNSDNCIIMIGSFSENKNSSKLKDKLSKAGYRIFETPYKGLTRIGIDTSCSPLNLKNELQKIKSEYAPDAIIFRKE